MSWTNSRPDAPSGHRGKLRASERRVDAAIHGAGLACAALASAALLLAGLPGASTGRAAAAILYAGGMDCMFACSAAYNLVQRPRPKALLRRLDHAAIFGAIAGTYTPLAVIAIGGDTGFALFAVVWLAAAAGAVMKLWHPSRFERLSLLSYLALGWVIVAAARPVLAAVKPHDIALLVLGGILYNVGVVFYMQKRLSFQNAIWHGFVLLAAGVQYAAVWHIIAG